MAIVLCHSPKGGVGTTFLAAHVAMGLIEHDQDAGLGRDVALLTLSSRDLTPLHFGLPPAQRLPSLSEPAEGRVLAGGISLHCEPRAASDPDFLLKLEDAGFLGSDGDRTLVVDVPAGEQVMARRLMALASVHLCPLSASPDCLALLPQMLVEADEWGAARTAFVFGRLDETRRLSRHVASFAREVLGERLIAKIRNDQAVPEALAMLQLLSRYAPSSAALADVRALAVTLAGMLAQERTGVEIAQEPAVTPLAPSGRGGASRAA